MPDLTRYDKYKDFAGPSDEERHNAYKNVQLKFNNGDSPMQSGGGNHGRMPPRLSKHHRIVIQGVRVKK